MIPISSRQQEIVSLLRAEGRISGTQISKLVAGVSRATIKRDMQELVALGYAVSSGAGRGAGYILTQAGRLFSSINARTYIAIEPDKRGDLIGYNFDLLPAIPGDIFSPVEIQTLQEATKEYEHRTTDLPLSIQKKELERLIIELSWKSSKIEGNTYTLLDTEKLIVEGKEAQGHSKEEAVMILNHKEAFNFVHQHVSLFKTLTAANLEKLHSILVKDLAVETGFRKRAVGVVGSTYKPLDNINQIKEAVTELSKAIKRISSPYAKAMIALLCISYIQPFADGNKRTARLMANGLLMAHGCAPLSYRSVDEIEYREAMLVFYELNSLVPFKDIFISQYDFAARNYAVK